MGRIVVDLDPSRPAGYFVDAGLGLAGLRLFDRTKLAKIVTTHHGVSRMADIAVARGLAKRMAGTLE